MSAGVPRLAEWLIERVVPAHARESVLGDLHERFDVRARRSGEGAARRWYWRQAIAFLVRLPVIRVVAGASPMRANGRARDPLGAGLLRDVRMAVRTLRRRPGLTVTAAGIVALAIGANATVFGVLKAVLLEDLPFPEPDRLVMLWDDYPTASRMPITLEHYEAWAARTDLFSGVGAWETVSPALLDGEWPERLEGSLVTANLLPLLGARPVLGRLLLPQDQAAGAEPVMVLGHELWSARFGADPAIVGRTLDVNGVRTRIVGVVAEDFWFYDPYSATRSISGRNAASARFWLPLPVEQGFYAEERNYPRYRVIARLQDGVTLEAAAASAALMRRELPPTSSRETAAIEMRPLTEQVVAEARPRLLAMLGAVTLVLLIACVNLASLLLVDLEARRAELSLRLALGAGRARLVRQLVLESTLLGAGGGMLGLLLAVPMMRWIVALVPRGLPLAHRVGLDAGVAAAGIAASLAAGAAVGLAAALRTDAVRPGAGMATAPRTVAGSRSSRRVHDALVCVEVALSLILLVGATLLVRSLAVLNGVDTGFDSEHVLTFEVSPAAGAAALPDGEFIAALEQRVRSLPGVLGAGATTALPFSRWGQSAPIEVDGAVQDRPPRIDFRLVSPGYFDAIALPLRAGRAFSASDRAGTQPVVVVNDAFVERWLDGARDPVGRTIAVTWFRERSVRTIAGVVANVKHNELFESNLPIVYAPMLQAPVPFGRFAVRTRPGMETTLIEPIRRVAAAIDPRRPLGARIPAETIVGRRGEGWKVSRSTLKHERALIGDTALTRIAFDALVAQSMEEERFHTQVLDAFAAVAVVLTLIGIHGVVSYTTRQRDREMGIRMALGAGATSVRRLVLTRGLAPVAIGLVLGIAGALAATRVPRGLLHGVAEHDLASFVAASAAFALVSAVACAVPARRAARLDPVQVLRGE